MANIKQRQEEDTVQTLVWKKLTKKKGSIMKKNHDIIDFESVKKNKQAQVEAVIINLYEQFMESLEKNANLREKVRAKHFFRSLTSVKETDFLIKSVEEHFFHWFAFDYRNIQGLTMFQLFLRNQEQRLTQPMLIQSALFLTAVLEPMVVEAIPEQHILEVYDPFHKQKHLIKTKEEHVQKNDSIFIRLVPAIGMSIQIGPLIKVSNFDVILELVRDYSKTDLSWRTFLKKKAIQYAWNGKTDR
jgi:hypothetical protein